MPGKATGKGFSVSLTPEVRAQINRLVTRFAIERIAAGWSTHALAVSSGMWRSNIDRFEKGETVPTLPVMLYLGHFIDLTLEWIPRSRLPLLELTEAELEALMGVAVQAVESEPGNDHLASALQKLGKVSDAS